MHPNLIANWKKQARQKVLAGFSGNHERQEASRETEITEVAGEDRRARHRAGFFFIQGLRSLSHAPESREWSIPPTPGSASYGNAAWSRSRASSFYYAGQGENPLNLRLMRLIDEQFLETPFYGSRQMTRWLRRQGDTVSRKRVRRLMRLLGVHVLSSSGPGRLSRTRRTGSIPTCCAICGSRGQTTCGARMLPTFPCSGAFLYLVAVMDWASRKVLSWRLSNTLDASFCVEALHEALERYGPPEIFNSDQGSQFTSVDFTDVLKEAGIRISMDGKGRWMDNVFIERLWRSLKYECVYLSEFATGSQARTGIGRWMDFYDRRRPHSSLNDRTPDEAVH